MNSPWEGHSSGPADRPDASGSPSPYSSDPHAGSPYPSDPLAPGRYGASPYDPGQYGAGQYPSGQYGAYDPNPYVTPYGGDPYAAAPYGAGANGPQYGSQYGYGPGYASGPPQSGLAVAALVCGILGFFTAGLASIGAVICGHLAWSDTSTGRQAGHGMTIAGLVLGYIPIVGWVLFWLVFAISIGSV